MGKKGGEGSTRKGSLATGKGEGGYLDEEILGERGERVGKR